MCMCISPHIVLYTVVRDIQSKPRITVRYIIVIFRNFNIKIYIHVLNSTERTQNRKINSFGTPRRIITFWYTSRQMASKACLEEFRK